MNNHNPVDLRSAQAKIRHSSQVTGRKIWIGVLVVWIVAAMSAWVTFLGWGLLEAWRAIEKLVVSFF
jgi:hypothetical protein